MRYEFKCNKCGKITVKSMLVAEMEDLLITDSDGILKCECGGEYKKMYSTTPIVVKGRGTYTVSFPNKET